MKTTAKERIKHLKGFIEDELWETHTAALSRAKRGSYRHLRIFYLAAKGFIDNRCLLQASGLTYTTLLSLVPLLALMFSILKGLGVQNTLAPLLLEKLSAGSEEVVTQIIGYIDRTNVKALGALGLVGLVGTAISLIGNIELALNGIWGVARTRTLGRKFSDYMSVLLTCPLLFAGALGATSSIQSADFVQRILELPGMSYLVLFLAKLSPYVLMWVAFTFLYSYLPNTTVRIRSALFGGIIGGTAWQLAQLGYIHFQVGVANANAIYGAFAQLPIFLVWLYVSWNIVLAGALLSATHQNIRTPRSNTEAYSASYAFREELGLKLLLLVAKSFYSGEEPWNADTLSRQLEVPVGVARDLLRQHSQAGFLIAATKDHQELFLPARPPETLGLAQVIEAMRDYGGDAAKTRPFDGDDALARVLEQVAESRRSALAHLTLKDLLTGKKS
jgi:membrane protein